MKVENPLRRVENSLSLRIRIHESDQDKTLYLELSTLFAELGHVPLDSSWVCRVSVP